MSSDRVLVLDKGTVKEMGSPKELARREGSVFGGMIREQKKHGMPGQQFGGAGPEELTVAQMDKLKKQLEKTHAGKQC